jgi:hypothetical protein
MIGHFGAGGDRQGTPMQGVHTIRIEISGKVRRTADTADGQDFMGFEAQIDARPAQAVENAKITAARTPVGVYPAFEVTDRLGVENQILRRNAIHHSNSLQLGNYTIIS